MKIAVIGGNRFIGKLLVKKLVESHKVVLFNRSVSGDENAEIIKFDRNINTIRCIAQNLDSFDCIVDMCLYNLKQFELIKEFIPKNIRYIFVSSAAVRYKDTFGSYAIEKENIEKKLSDTDLNYTIVRPSYVVGYGNHIMRLEYFINKLVGGESIKIDNGDCHINLVDVKDVVNCLEHIISSTNNLKGKIYEIGSDKETTVNEVIDIIKKELYIKEHTVEKSDESIFLNQHFEIDNNDIKMEFGIKFNDINHIVKSFIERWKNEN
jgi:nucleoside-diphosphate-sugar epimerase